MIVENFLQSAFHVSDDSLLITDSDYRVIDCNANAERMFARDFVMLRGASLSEVRFLQPDDEEIVLTILAGQQAPAVCSMLLPGGCRLPLVVTVLGYNAPPGRGRFLFSFQEITQPFSADRVRRAERSPLPKNPEGVQARYAVHDDAGGKGGGAVASIRRGLSLGCLPKNIPGVGLSGYSEVSGQGSGIFTFTRLDEDCFEILMGDVVGEKEPAHLTSARVKADYRRLLLGDTDSALSNGLPSPEKLINALHARLMPALRESESIVRLVMLRFDRRTRILSWANAGHTPVMLAGCNGSPVTFLQGEDPAMGKRSSGSYCQEEVCLELGDTLLVYSDAIPAAHARCGEHYGEVRISEILSDGQALGASPTMIIQALRSDVLDFSEAGQRFRDRMAAVFHVRPMRRNQRGAIHDRQVPEFLDLPRQLHGLVPLRERIAILTRDQPDEIADSLILAAFEAATNIIRHTPEKLCDSPFTAILQRDDHSLVVELVYAGEPFTPSGPATADFSGNSFGGFGLYIIEHCVDQVVYSRPMRGMASIRLIKHLFPKTGLSLSTA